jgi:hypothetical protein
LPVQGPRSPGPDFDFWNESIVMYLVLSTAVPMGHVLAMIRLYNIGMKSKEVVQGLLNYPFNMPPTGWVNYALMWMVLPTDGRRKFREAIGGYIEEQDFGLRFWHAVFCYRGLIALTVGNDTSWYKGKIEGLSFGIDLNAVCMTRYDSPVKILGLRPRKKGAIKIVKPCTFPVMRVRIANRNGVIQFDQNWVGYNTQDLVTFVDAIVNPKLLPLCLAIEDEVVHEIVVRALERL